MEAWQVSKADAGASIPAWRVWEPALAVARAQEASKTRPGEGDIAKLEQCDSLFQTALESLPVADRGALRAEHTAFLRYRIEDAVCRGDLVLASTLLDRVETVIGAGSTATAHLRLVLDHRLNVPSHEKAFALIERDPEAAAQPG